MGTSVGLGLGLTGLSLFLQSGTTIAAAAIGANAAGEAYERTLEFLAEFLGEPINLAIIAGVIAIVVLPKGK
jgi:hypothetical protein